MQQCARGCRGNQRASGRADRSRRWPFVPGHEWLPDLLSMPSYLKDISTNVFTSPCETHLGPGQPCGQPGRWEQGPADGVGRAGVGRGAHAAPSAEQCCLLTLSAAH